MSMNNYGTFIRLDLPIETMIKMKKSGMSNNQIAKHFDISVPTVRARLKEYAPELCGESIKTSKVEFDDDVLDLRLFGLSKTEIGRLYGCHPDTATKQIRKVELESGKKLSGYIPVTLNVNWELVERIEAKGLTVFQVAKDNGVGVLDILLALNVKK